MRARDVTGRPVIDVGSAVEVGRVRSVIVDAQGGRVVGFLVGADQPVLPLVDVRAIGPDALTVDEPSVLRMPSSDAEVRAAEVGRDPVGRRVLGDDGTSLGTIDDIEFETDGTVSWLVVDGREVEGGRLLGIGDHAVVVRAPAT